MNWEQDTTERLKRGLAGGCNESLLAALQPSCGQREGRELADQCGGGDDAKTMKKNARGLLVDRHGRKRQAAGRVDAVTDCEALDFFVCVCDACSSSLGRTLAEVSSTERIIKLPIHHSSSGSMLSRAYKTYPLDHLQHSPQRTNRHCWLAESPKTPLASKLPRPSYAWRLRMRLLSSQTATELKFYQSTMAARSVFCLLGRVTDVGGGACGRRDSFSDLAAYHHR